MSKVTVCSVEFEDSIWRDKSTTSWPTRTCFPSAQESGVMRGTYAVWPGLVSFDFIASKRSLEKVKVSVMGSYQERWNICRVRDRHVGGRVIQ